MKNYLNTLKKKILFFPTHVQICFNLNNSNIYRAILLSLSIFPSLTLSIFHSISLCFDFSISLSHAFPMFLCFGINSSFKYVQLRKCFTINALSLMLILILMYLFSLNIVTLSDSAWRWEENMSISLSSFYYHSHIGRLIGGVIL